MAQDDTRQVATRVGADTFEILHLAMTLEGAATMQDLLRPVVESFAAALREEPEIQEMLKLSEQYRARKSKVQELHPRGKRSGKK